MEEFASLLEDINFEEDVSGWSTPREIQQENTKENSNKQKNCTTLDSTITMSEGFDIQVSVFSCNKESPVILNIIFSATL